MQSDSNVYFEFSVRLSILLWFLPNDSTLFAFSLRNNPMCPNSLGCRTQKPTHFIHIDAIPLHCNAFALWPAGNLLVKPCFIVVLHFHHLCVDNAREKCIDRIFGATKICIHLPIIVWWITCVQLITHTFTLCSNALMDTRNWPWNLLRANFSHGILI